MKTSVNNIHLLPFLVIFCTDHMFYTKKKNAKHLLAERQGSGITPTSEFLVWQSGFPLPLMHLKWLSNDHNKAGGVLSLFLFSALNARHQTKRGCDSGANMIKDHAFFPWGLMVWNSKPIPKGLVPREWWKTPNTIPKHLLRKSLGPLQHLPSLSIGTSKGGLGRLLANWTSSTSAANHLLKMPRHFGIGCTFWWCLMVFAKNRFIMFVYIVFFSFCCCCCCLLFFVVVVVVGGVGVGVGFGCCCNLSFAVLSHLEKTQKKTRVNIHIKQFAGRSHSCKVRIGNNHRCLSFALSMFCGVQFEASHKWHAAKKHLIDHAFVCRQSHPPVFDLLRRPAPPWGTQTKV